MPSTSGGARGLLGGAHTLSWFPTGRGSHAKGRASIVSWRSQDPESRRSHNKKLLTKIKDAILRGFDKTILFCP